MPTVAAAKKATLSVVGDDGVTGSTYQQVKVVIPHMYSKQVLIPPPPPEPPLV